MTFSSDAISASTPTRTAWWLGAMLVIGINTVAHAQTGSSTVTRPIQRVVIMDLEVGPGIDTSTGRIVADNVVVEVRKLQGLSVVGMAEVRAMLEAESNKQAMGCDAESSCLAEVADALGADVLITGSMAMFDGSQVLSLRRIDQTRAAVAGEVQERLANNGEALLAAVGPAIEKLFPEMPLKQGETRGVPPEKALVLNPPPLPVWSTVTVGVATGIVALAGVGLGVGSELTRQQTQDTIDSSKVQPVDGTRVREGIATSEGLALGANVALLSAGGLALTTAAMALFTDWTDAAGERDRLAAGE